MMFKYYKRFYLFMLNAKCYMGIYFAAIVFVCGLILAFNGQASIPLLVLLEIWLLIDIVLALCGRFRDRNGRRITQWQQ